MLPLFEVFNYGYIFYFLTISPRNKSNDEEWIAFDVIFHDH